MRVGQGVVAMVEMHEERARVRRGVVDQDRWAVANPGKVQAYAQQREAIFPDGDPLA